jgi:hypothetical protein
MLDGKSMDLSAGIVSILFSLKPLIVTSPSQITENKFYPRMKYIKKVLIIISIFAFITACQKDKGGDAPGGGNSSTVCGTVAKTFSTDAKPLIQASCASAGCHGTGSGNGPGALTTYTQIFNARSGIRAAVNSGAMPKNGTLTTAQKNTIICWIDNGALDN